jgi:hypothetical protein
MSGRIFEGKRGLLGSFRFPKLCKNPTLTYDENAAEINGKGFSGTIPVSSISAVLIETKRATPLLISAIIAMIIDIVCIAIAVATYDGGGYGMRGGGEAVGIIGGILGCVWIILLAMYFMTEKASFSIISDGYAYTLSVEGNEETLDDLKKTKDELSKIVVAGRKAVN